MSTIVCRRVIVRGKVQGVGYRAATLREAIRIGNLSGSVANLDDGTVEIIVQGSGDGVAALVAWARQGPPASRVDGLSEDERKVDPALPSFGIKA